jgi:uncharacterized pyridoxamine 5'-phosphate oxidase family protein
MSKTIAEIRQEVWDQFSTMQCVYLATAEADQPRVRPVTLLDIDKKFWIATSPRSGKARQILRNPNVEFCLPLKKECGEGYIRVSGLADLEKDETVRAHIGNQIPFLTQHWSGVDDPNFTLFRITRVEVEYMRPGEMEAYTFIV